MPDKPILFSAPMVRALLDGRKTQTRRVIKPQPFASGFHDGDVTLDQVWEAHARFSAAAVGGGAFLEEVVPLRYAIGDRLWVREAWAKAGDAGDDLLACPDLRVPAYYRADDVSPEHSRWRPSIFMPRWASRITLTVTDVRVQRVQDISEADAIAEGVEWINPPASFGPDTSSEEIHGIGCQIAFRDLWNEIHGPDVWGLNDWVAAYSFAVRRGNIDAAADE